MHNAQRGQKYHGILLVMLFACSSFYLADFILFKKLSFSPLIIGIIIGMIYANTLKNHMPVEWVPGVQFSSKKILRLAIILYGFRLTLQNIVEVGTQAIIIDLIVIIVTLVLGIVLGKLLKLDKEIALLTATGSAICGAAAILGAESAINNKPYKTAVAVSTVIIFGTLSMFLYPFLYHIGFFHLNAEQWGVFTGSTVHEVAHVVGAANAMSPEIAATAIIVKMIRVIFLAPVLIVFVFCFHHKKKTPDAPKSKITIPWFAFGFIAVIGFNSLHLLPNEVVGFLNTFDTFLLTMAMTALGMETHFRKFKETGAKPFILAAILYVWLIFGGFLLVKYLMPYFM